MEAAEAKSDLGHFRTISGAWRTLFLAFTALGVVLSVNQIFNLKFFVEFVILDNSYLYLLLGVFFSIVFLIFPATAKSPRDRIPWYDYVLFGIVIAITIYYALTGLQSLEQGWEYDSPLLPAALAIVMWALILEGARRTGGWARGSR